ncbi:MAG: hypothetical protein F4089_16060 [Gammaproteobacteria bacterium]|nr:hypothetical protein [Gammaproteobacteria bacterium]MYJ76501.1 hypothetical protein [Gammaproteobacteria bacterium]
MPGADLAQFPLLEGKAKEFLRAAAGDSEKLVIDKRDAPADEVYFEVLASNQITRCLREGEIVGKIQKDDYGHYECVVTRLCAGVDVYVTVAIDTDEGKVYVLHMESIYG